MTKDKDEGPLLLRTLPEQVSKRWDKFAPLLEKSLPPTVTARRQRMANVLRAILTEDLQVWVYYNEQSQERYVVSTQIKVDEISLGKDLLIYSFTSIGQITPREVRVGLEVLAEYARGNGCNSIIAYSADDRLVKFAESEGAKANYKLIQIEV